MGKFLVCMTLKTLLWSRGSAGSTTGMQMADRSLWKLSILLLISFQDRIFTGVSGLLGVLVVFCRQGRALRKGSNQKCKCQSWPKCQFPVAAMHELKEHEACLRHATWSARRWPVYLHSLNIKYLSLLSLKVTNKFCIVSVQAILPQGRLWGSLPQARWPRSCTGWHWSL